MSANMIITQNNFFFLFVCVCLQGSSLRLGGF